jgi:fluoride exporter
LGIRAFLQTLLYVGAGGFVGANLRYLVSIAVPRLFPEAMVVSGTFFVNVTGSLLLAVFLTWVSHQVNVPVNVRLLIATGFFGSYTTFSSFASESVALLRDNSWLAAAAYVLGTNFACGVAAFMGVWLGNRI